MHSDFILPIFFLEKTRSAMDKFLDVINIYVNYYSDLNITEILITYCN